jgi:dephospho-CoA kinase
LHHFGPHFLNADGQLNRAALRQHMQSEPAAQQALNAILHPLIRQHLADQIALVAEAGHQVAFVEAALLLEAGSAAQYDAILLVTAPFPTRISRVVARDGVSPAQARGLMRRQWPDSRKKPLAHAVLVNGGDLRTLADRLDAALLRLGLPLTPSPA